MVTQNGTTPRNPHDAATAVDDDHQTSGGRSAAGAQPDAPTPADDDRPRGGTDADSHNERPVEIGGQKGPEPTRYGDWEKNGRCTDF